MAYTVLARRYRSGTFDEVIGQDHVSKTLKKAIASDRIAHAFLFTGTRGVGKTSMARILAKALNCLSADKPTTEPCGKCSSCEAIAKGEDIDVIEIDAASNTGVDNVRDIIENARFRPARARFKIYIIDEVHMLSKAAFNALLKIMEEPPEHVKFILATTEVDKILPTILSRCQRYDFRNIPTREIAQHLKKIVDEEKVKADDDAIALVARAGAGSMRDSLSLLDRLLSVGEKHLSAQTIEQMLGMPRAQAIFELAGAIGSGDVKATLTQANGLIDGGLSADTLVASLIDHFHQLLVAKTCGIQSGLVDLVGFDEKTFKQQADQFDAATLTQDIALLEELRRQMRSSQAGRAILDASLARLAMSAQFASIGDLVAELNGAARAVEKKKPELSGSTNPAQPSALRASARSENEAQGSSQLVESTPTSEFKITDPTRVLDALLDRLHDRYRAMLQGAQQTHFDQQTGRLRLRFSEQYADNGVHVRDARTKFARAMADSLGCAITLEVDVEEPKVVQREIAPDTRPRAIRPNLEDVERETPETESVAPDLSAYQSHPLIKAITERFSARIVRVERPGSP